MESRTMGAARPQRVTQMQVFAAGMACVLATLACASTQKIDPFVSDGCSAFIDGTSTDPDRWQFCCYEHDVAYWKGGSREQRREADDALRACVAEVEDIPLARLVHGGVRFGGSPWWPTGYRWGYGWPYGRGYRTMTPEQEQHADAVLSALMKLYPPPPRPLPEAPDVID